ncbi:hypothetical protein F6B41_00775 [Microbacterium lushaniae]|nr:hypothetical protein F6B41_32380 [Microbacterium lushaniae]KAA9159490.1 hypothetical protein F6B41_00775 [Microbacterium lushaniae]
MDPEDMDGVLPSVRSNLAEAGITVAPAYPSWHRKQDVIFTHEDVAPDEVAELIRTMAPDVVFVQESTFDARDLDTEDEAAAGYDGAVYQVEVMWPSAGLLYLWFATAAWYDNLLAETEIAAYQERGLGQMEFELTMQRARAAHQELMGYVLASPEVRRATTNRRTPHVTVVMDAHPELVEDLFSSRSFPKFAREAAAAEVARWESALDGDEDVLAEVAEAIIGARSLAREREITGEVLRARADGWTLTTDFVERILRRARERRRR